VVGVQEEVALQALKRVQQCREDEAEDDDRLAVGLPVLLPRRVGAKYRAEAALEASEPAARRKAIDRVDARHVEAERIRERDEDGRVDEHLADALTVHLEALAEEQGVDEVDQDGDGDGEPERVRGRHQTRSST
jgi:hypothetical protein